MNKKPAPQRLPKNVLEKAAAAPKPQVKLASAPRHGRKDNAVKTKVIAALKRLHPMD